MKITKRQLRKIIKEETVKLLKEAPRYGEDYADVDSQAPQFTLSPESREWAAAYDQLYDELRNAFAAAQEAGLIVDDIDNAIKDAKDYIHEINS